MKKTTSILVVAFISLAMIFSTVEGNALTKTKGGYPVHQKKIVLVNKTKTLQAYKKGANRYSMGRRAVLINKALKKLGYHIKNTRSDSYDPNLNIGVYSSLTAKSVKKFKAKNGWSKNTSGTMSYTVWKKLMKKVGWSETAWSAVYTPELLVKPISSRNDHINAMIKTAEKHIKANTKYGYGCSTSPNAETPLTDCSGLVIQCLYAAGVKPSTDLVEHTNCAHQFGSRDLSNDKKLGPLVSVNKLKRGDLVFYGSPVNHVGIYVGNKKIIDNLPKGGVHKRSLYSYGQPTKARRVF